MGWLFLAGGNDAWTSESEDANRRLRFSAAGQGEFTFNTGVLRGQLHAGGKSLGLSQVIHIPTGQVLDQSNGLFSHYRVFSKGRRYGNGAWDWPSSAVLLPEGAVEARWESAPDRPFAMRAVYRWSAADTLDLTTIVLPTQALPAFEVFLALYFHSAFTNCSLFLESAKTPDAPAQFVPAARALGDWLMAPRNSSMVPLIQDGRWKLEPNPVSWVILPAFGAPLAMRRAPVSNLAAVSMARPEDCFALATPHEAEGHFSLYHSLFGRDLKAGERIEARSRLVIAEGLSAADAEQRYRIFLETAGTRPDSSMEPRR